MFNKLKQCRHGLMVYNQNDVYIGASLELYGEYSEGEVDVFRKLIREGDVVVEAGANIGAHTVFFARTVGSSGKVFAWEPQRIVFQTLCANIAVNSFDNVWCFNSVLGRESGTVLMPSPDPHVSTNFGGISALECAKGEFVPMVSIDSLDLKRCDLVKVDVEGMEKDVLAGARATIERCHPTLYVENDRTDRSDELIRFIDELGYDMYWHTPYLFNRDNFSGHAENIFKNVISKNMLCIHGSKPQLGGFKKVEVPG